LDQSCISSGSAAAIASMFAQFGYYDAWPGSAYSLLHLGPTVNISVQGAEDGVHQNATVCLAASAASNNPADEKIRGRPFAY
jgi:hypothetical protein